MQITLELNNHEDENLLLSLLQRLGIQYSINESVESQRQVLPNQETLLAIEAVERGEVERTSLKELRKLAQV
jgi:uncharacterized protein YwgA